MKKAVAIALFGGKNTDGSGMEYASYLYPFVLAHLNLFPREEGWQLCLFYDGHTGGRPTQEFIRRLCIRRLCDAELIVSPCGDVARTRAMLWRLIPIFWNQVENQPGAPPRYDYVFCRDLDSLPSPRDRMACDTFIQSKRAVHTIHDSVSHAGIMGGLCGFNAKLFRDVTGFKKLDDVYSFGGKTEEEWARHGTDQVVLNKIADTFTALTLLEHRYDGWHYGPGKMGKRVAGIYRCKAVSAPTPGRGKTRIENGDGRYIQVMPFGYPSLNDAADRVAAHMGSAGYDIGQAREFWQAFGDQDVAAAVTACEPTQATLVRGKSLPMPWCVEVANNTRSANRGLMDFAHAVTEALRRRGHEIVPPEAAMPKHKLLFGASSPEAEVGVEPGTILYNAEQIAQAKDPFRLIKGAEPSRVIWDYSQENVKRWHALGLPRALHCPVGYISTMETIAPAADEDIDVLFYGWMNPRREEILLKLEDAGLKVVKLFGVFGRERDEAIARAKVVLNLHYYDYSSFEIFRCSHLFANRKCVVTEGGGTDPVLEALAEAACAYASKPHELIQSCRYLCDNAVKRRFMAERGYETFKKIDLVENVRMAIEDSA